MATNTQTQPEKLHELCKFPDFQQKIIPVHFQDFRSVRVVVV